jgi:CBS domain containing-hemolysin-like protein
VSNSDWLEAIGVLLLVLAVAFLSAAEVTITRTGRARAYRLAEEGRRGAKSLEKIVENVAPYLNVVLLLTLMSTIGGTTLATILVARHLDRWAELVSTVGMTLILFIFAEVTPKTFAVQHTDRVALRLAPIIVAVTRAVGPVAHLLVGIANVVLPGRGLPEGPFATEQEIRAMAEVASDEESIEEEEKELIHSIFEFGDTVVREVMVPRPDMITAPESARMQEVLDLILRHGYSRIPIYRENVDDIVGVAYAKDLLRHLHAGKAGTDLANIMREPYFVPESKKVSDLMREMQQRAVHIAIVLDEYGSTAGLVTIEDLLEEIVGEIADEYDREEPEIEPVGENRYRVNGRASIDDVNELLEVELPDDEWDTVAGLMYGLLGSVPTQGETVRYGDLEFMAQKVQGRRIATILITRHTDAPADAAAQDASGAAANAE